MQATIPRNTIAAFVAWALNFAAKLVANPATYMLDASEASAVDDAVSDLDAEWQAAGVLNRVANDPASYTQPNRATLYAARDAAMAICSQYAVQIQANNAISDADKLDAGVLPRNFDRSPVFVPQSAPLLSVMFATPGAMQLHYADTTTPDSKKKPFGAKYLQVYIGIGDDPVFGDAKHYGEFTKNPVVVAFDGSDDGKKAKFWARWIGVRGDTGPWSAPVEMTVSF